MENYKDNRDLILSQKDSAVPAPAMVEKIIREGIASKHGEVYTCLMLHDWVVDSCDAKNLVMHSGSAFQCEVIRARLAPEIATIINAIYDIQPAISIICKE